MDYGFSESLFGDLKPIGVSIPGSDVGETTRDWMDFPSGLSKDQDFMNFQPEYSGFLQNQSQILGPDFKNLDEWRFRHLEKQESSPKSCTSEIWFRFTDEYTPSESFQNLPQEISEGFNQEDLRIQLPVPSDCWEWNSSSSKEIAEDDSLEWVRSTNKENTCVSPDMESIEPKNKKRRPRTNKNIQKAESFAGRARFNVTHDRGKLALPNLKLQISHFSFIEMFKILHQLCSESQVKISSFEKSSCYKSKVHKDIITKICERVNWDRRKKLALWRRIQKKLSIKTFSTRETKLISKLLNLQRKAGRDSPSELVYYFPGKTYEMCIAQYKATRGLKL